MKTCVIYALVDEIGVPRYVGQTNKRLATRLSQHFSLARNGPWNRPLDAWLRACPTATIIPLEVNPGNSNERERHWIKQMRAGGIDLLNITPGGNGEGHRRSADVVEKTASKRRGRPISDEHRSKLSVAHTGVPLSAAHKAAIGRGTASVPRTPEWNRNISEAKRGDRNPMSAKNRAARTARGTSL